jgi:serine/threonine protein kinase
VPAALVDHPRYRVLELLGRGGMGIVYKVEHRLMERPVALKVVNHHLTTDPAAVERFRREVKAAARLRHPNIVTAYDAEQAGDTHFLVMEFVEGISLAHLVKERGPLPVAQACDFVRQAALGLQYAHEQGMVHRDIKPHNLMVTRATDGQSGGLVKVLDFGLARFAVESLPANQLLAADGAAWSATLPEALTKVGTIMGTPDYMAPEQARDAHTADIRADIYSLGCTLYYLLAGQVPFTEASALGKIQGHLERSPRPLTVVRRDVPTGLQRVLERMMAKDPAQRYQTPSDAASALTPFVGRQRALSAWQWLVVAVGLFTVAGLASWGIGSALLHRAWFAGQTVQADPKSPSNEVRSFKGHMSAIKTVAFSPDGKRVLSGSGYNSATDFTMRLWDVETGEEVRRFAAHRDYVQCVIFSPGGKRALSSSADSTVRLWDVDGGQELRCFSPPINGAWVNAAVFCPDERRILLGGAGDCVVRLYDAASGEELRQFKGRKGVICGLALSRGGRRALIARGPPANTAELWDVEAGKELHCFEGHTELVEGVAFSPDGWRAFSASQDKTVRLWDVKSGQEIHQFLGHTDCVTSVACSPDGRRLLSGSFDRTMRLWEVQTGRELRRFEGHTDIVWSVAYSPDGRYAISGSADRTMRLWRLPDPDRAQQP